MNAEFWSGRRVLLIDSDLRKPAFKAASDRFGLSKLLTTDDQLAAHIVETQHENLWLLPSGPLPPNPADLLSTGRIRKIINEAKEAFDLVVIDGPPTLGLADAPLLAAAAGTALFVVESGKTRTHAAVEALVGVDVVELGPMVSPGAQKIRPAEHALRRRSGMRSMPYEDPACGACPT